MVPWNGGSVLAGRSLRLVEQREDNALAIAGLAWLVGMAGIVIAAVIAERLTGRVRRRGRDRTRRGSGARRA